ncbi:AraC family transcriptional regulator [Coraliomargarita sp. SDUM461003]|uniref:AraC family transcriptional regulator n=1 Tax=Thalassobacterium maritimum TaxID=3041265 RepID=A0ABU1ARL8_9BACT|nr:AraC family transcriptional regulator [Coraliomargarita sp. SDUM461003]MDQ8206688.1 AraC family transcriptional regulator [Coraliomargarita sp. SDUM461003]
MRQDTASATDSHPIPIAANQSVRKDEPSTPLELLQPLRLMANAVEVPDSLFNGLRIRQSPTPDNIIIFDRRDRTAFRPEGVSHNFHHRFELVCVLEGSGSVRIGEQSFLLEPGDCALIHPNQFHHYMDVDAKQLDWLFITFEMNEADSLATLKSSPRRLDATGILGLQNTLLHYHANDGKQPNALETAYHLSHFLKHMRQLRNIPDQRIYQSVAEDDSRDAILEQINSYVRDHLSDAPTISDLAEGIGYSVSHIRAVFRDRLGVSLGRYIRESRLSEAAKLLQDSDLNVTEVAKRTGFDSLFAFSRAFKNTYGMPPKAYSLKIRNGPSQE